MFCSPEAYKKNLVISVTPGYKNRTITQPVIMTFRVFLLNSLPPAPIFYFLLPSMTSKSLHSQVCLSGGVCVVTLASFSPVLCSQLNTTLPSSKWCLRRRAGECDPLWENDVNYHSKDLNQKRDGWKVRSREQRAERQAVRGCRIWRFYRETRTKKRKAATLAPA